MLLLVAMAPDSWLSAGVLLEAFREVLMEGLAREHSEERGQI